MHLGRILRDKGRTPCQDMGGVRLLQFNFLSHVAAYATYSDLFGMPYGKGTLSETVKNLPVGGLLDVLSQLMQLPTNKVTLKDEFVRFLGTLPSGRQIAPLVDSKLRDRVLITPQGLLSVWKWVLAHGNPETQNVGFSDSGRAMAVVVYLGLIVSDYLHEPGLDDRPLEYEMLQNAFFNTESNLYLSLGRAHLMYSVLAMSRQLFEEREYVDINADFQAKYGFEPVVYLAVIFSLIAPFLREDPKVEANWARPFDEYYSTLSLKGEAEQLLSQLGLTFDEGRLWAQKALVEPWDFSLLWRKPMFVINGYVFPISISFLADQVFWGLHQRCRECYDAQDNRYGTFTGRVFEQYVVLVARESLKGSQGLHEFIPEFRYSGGRRSPDLMIRLGSKLLAVEVKTRRLTHESRVYGTLEAIDDDLDKALVQPLNQCLRRVEELREKRTKTLDLTGVSEVYIMTVSVGHIPTLPPFERKLRNELGKGTAKGFYHLDVEEFEWLCGLMERVGLEKVFEYLDDKEAHAPHLSFRSFALEANLPQVRPRYLESHTNELMHEIQDLLFPPS